MLIGDPNINATSLLIIFILAIICNCDTFTYAHFLPSCQILSRQHVKGAWKYREEIRHKEFVCCSSKNLNNNNNNNNNNSQSSSILDDSHCGTGMVHDVTPDYYRYHQGINNGSIFDYSGGCSCDISMDTRGTVSSREKYIWDPTSCSLLAWNSSQFCSLLGSRRILIIGDSTMHQTAVELMNMLTAGGCADRVMYGLAAWLTWKSPVEVPWTKYVEKALYPEIVVLGAGAHMADLGDYWSIWSVLIDQIKSLKITHPNVKVLWKTINPGHYHCTNISSPTTTYSPAGANEEDIFHWDTFPILDELASNHSRTAGIGVIDVSPLYLRGDAHPALNQLLLHKKTDHDCLHFCSPGPLALFAQLMLQMLHNKEI